MSKKAQRHNGLFANGLVYQHQLPINYTCHMIPAYLLLKVAFFVVQKRQNIFMLHFFTLK